MNKNIPQAPTHKEVKVTAEELSDLVELEGGKTAEEWEALSLKYLTEGGYDGVGHFHNGRAWVRKDSTYHFIKEDGTELSKERYEDAMDFHDGRAGVRKGNQWFFIKEDGTELSSERYDGLYDFIKGRAAVVKNNVAFYIDLDGKPIP